MQTVEVMRLLAGLLGERTLGKVRYRVEGRRLGWGRGHGGQAGLGLELGLDLVVLVLVHG